MGKFTIKYEIYFIDGSKLSDKEINVDHCYNTLEAQCRLEDYLRKKYPNIRQLVVFTCKPYDHIANGMFGDIFGKEFGDLFNFTGKK